MNLSKSNLPTIMIPLLVSLYLFSIGFNKGQWENLTIFLFLIIAASLHIFEMKDLRIRKRIFWFFLFFLTIKIGSEVISFGIINNILDTFMIIYLISIFVRFVNLNIFLQIIFFLGIVNLVVCLFQKIGVPQMHVWNTLIEAEIRSQLFEMSGNIKEIQGGISQVARPPGVFHSQAYNSAFSIGLLFHATRNNNLFICLIATLSCLICGSKSAFLLLLAFNVWLLIHWIWYKNPKSITNFVIGMLLILLYVSTNFEFYKDNFSLGSFIFSALLRIGPFLFSFMEGAGAAFAIYKDTRIMDSSNDYNFDLNIIIAFITSIVIYLFFPKVRNAIKSYLFFYMPIIVICLITPISGSLICLLLCQYNKK
jgi:hypothetical protein